MNKILVASFAFGFLALAVSGAGAHGFKVDINPASQLVLTSEDLTAGGLSIYKVQSLLGPAAFRSNDHPGYEAVSGFTGGETVRFDVLSKLWYSSGAAPVPSQAGLNLVITPQDGAISGSVTVSGTSGFQSGFVVGVFDGVALGTFEHQLNYELDFSPSVPAGAYALVMRLTGETANHTPLVPSAPFVAVFNNSLPIGNFPAIANQLYASAIASAVPEPATWVLGGLALVGLLVVRGGRAVRACVDYSA